MDCKKICSVRWVNSYISNMISQDFMLKSLYVKGEASNIKHDKSQHLYFTLKEGTSALQCIKFHNAYAKKGKFPDGLNFELKDGDEIIVHGKMQTYEKRGTYSLIVDSIEKSGKGEIYEKYMKLKKELEEMGMFDDQYKLPLPKYPKRIGLIAAEDGKAVEDVITSILDRNEHIEIVVVPTFVQGDRSAPDVVNAIQKLKDLNVDIIVLARGGGTMEDLWAFNERIVCEAVFNSKIPIVSAIGHTGDAPIATFVADVNAHVPANVGEKVIKSMESINHDLDEYRDSYMQLMLNKVQELKNRLSLLENALKLSSPDHRIKSQEERLLQDENRINQMMLQILQRNKVRLQNSEKNIRIFTPERKVQETRNRLKSDLDRLNREMDKKLMNYQHKFAICAEKMDGLSPLTKLSGGYAFVKKTEGAKVTKAKELKENDAVSLYFLDGYAHALISEVHVDSE